MSAFRWTPPDHPGPPLIITPRMADVLTRLHKGMSNAEIARELYLSTEAVKSRVACLLHESGCVSRTHLVAVTASRTVVVHARGRRAA